MLDNEEKFVCKRCNRDSVQYPNLKIGAKGLCKGCTSIYYSGIKRVKNNLEKIRLKKKNCIDYKLVYQIYSEFQKAGFPYPNCSKEVLCEDYNNLRVIDLSKLVDDQLIKVNRIGLKVANAFCRSKFVATKRNRISVKEAFNNKKLCMFAIGKVLSDKIKNTVSQPQLLNALRRANGVARINNFRPTIAKYVCCNFCPPGGTVYDFSAGYGGRLVGAASSHVSEYFGIDPHTQAFDELRKLANWLKEQEPNKKFNFENSCAEDFCPSQYQEYFDLAFSSPPYYDAEIYSKQQTQSCYKYKTYNTWKKKFLQKIIKNVWKLLKPNGLFVINIASTQFSLEADTVAFSKKIGFRFEDMYEIEFSERVANYSKFTEPIFIFRKKLNQSS